MKKLPLFYKGKSGGINFAKDDGNRTQAYLFLYLIFIFLFFLVMILRLFQLTVVKGDYYRRLSEGNRIREIVIEPQRGRIFDRKGFVIAKNTKADINLSLPRLVSARTYKEEEAIGHLVGYRQTADKADIENDNCLNKLKSGDKVGKKGVEKLFDCYLRGRAGKKMVETDARGASLNTISVIPPQDGEDVHLAFDLELQKTAYNLIKDKKAVVIGLKPETGEVLILASSPSFDPQDFEDMNDEAVAGLLTHTDKPLFNRALEGTYPPGSVFKPVVAVAALEEEKITAKTMFEDTGTIKAGPITFGNWYFLQNGKTDGMIDIVGAIRRSNDIFFYKTGERLGAEKIKLWADWFGYGKTTNIGLDEVEGVIPSPFWKEENIKDQWYLGDTYNLSIGQGYLLTTPIQVAQATAVLANNGYLCRPVLLKAEKNNADLLLSKHSKPECVKLPIAEKTLTLIREGMKEACQTGGTGWPLFDFGIGASSSATVKIPVACKTGTAESHARSGLAHAWFTVYAPSGPPAGGPEIVLTVLVEEGGQGSDVAAPIARDILKAYFERNE
jgi:penicillin-binding protein 2